MSPDQFTAPFDISNMLRKSAERGAEAAAKREQVALDATTGLPPLVPCGAPGCRQGCAWPDQRGPCYGEIQPIEEVEPGSFVHACRGHVNFWDDGEYVPFKPKEGGAI